MQRIRIGLAGAGANTCAMHLPKLQALSELTIEENDRGNWRVEEEFVNAIRGKEKITHTTFSDGVKYMAFTEAVYQSLTENRPVKVSSR